VVSSLGDAIAGVGIGGSLSGALPLGQEAMQGVDGRSHQFQQGIWDFNFRINAFHYALEARGMPISRASHGSRRPTTWPGAKKTNVILPKQKRGKFFLKEF
jgi:hypothetical protein